MTVEIADFPTVAVRVAELNCLLPNGLVMLPSNFSDVEPGAEFRFDGETSTAVKLLRAAGLPATRLNACDHKEAFIHNHSADWMLPIIFVGSEIMKTNPDMLSLAINVLQDYVLDRFKNINAKPTVKAQVVIENRRTKQTKCLTYEGNAEGLHELTAAVKALNRK